MFSYMNRLLRVDLTSHSFSEQALDESLISDYVGGRGFGARLLWDAVEPGSNPLGPGNTLIVLAGPLAGTAAQSFSRWEAFFKSPLTGGFFRSGGGGHFAAELKCAGFDGIFVEGRSDHPVYLWIHDGRYELRDATYLTGLDCDDTHALIREELHDPNVRVACIGPAGERLVRFAGIFTDRRTAGRGGGGAVMGAKNLKAIAVRGHGKVGAADPDALARAVREQVQAYRAHQMYPGFSRTGTQMMAGFINTLGMYPVRNFRPGELTGWENVDEAAYDRLRVRNTACHACMIHCGSIAKVSSGRYAGSWSEGPEYEGTWAFTGPVDCSDIGLTVAADHLCDVLGIDTISTAGAIGYAYELYERGIITKSDTGGLDLVYGNDQPVLPLIRQIAHRQGIGDVLAEGTRLAAKRIGQGSERYAMQVKGLELPAYDPRGAQAHGLNFMTTSIGADHNSGYGVQELFGTPYKVNRFTVRGKAAMTARNQDTTAIRELGIMCSFAALFLEDFAIYGRLLAAATGIAESTDDDFLYRVGERINCLERMFNVREGFGRKDDSVPLRFTEEPMPAGPAAGHVLKADKLLADYYRVRDWDPHTGIPRKAKLDALGLSFTIR